MKKRLQNLNPKVIATIVTFCIAAGIIAIFFQQKIRDYSYVYLLPSQRQVNEAGQISPNTMGTSYLIYGVNVDISQLVPNSPRYVVNASGQDLIDVAHNLGVNTLRITNAAIAFPDRPGNFTQAEWHAVLDKMTRYNMKAIVLLETPNLDPNDFSQNYLALAQSYIDLDILSDPIVWAVDIRNEPLINSDNINVMKKVAVLIKNRYPNIQITIGGWKIYNPNGPQDNDPFSWNDPKAGKQLYDIVDFYSTHIYGYDQKFLGIFPNPYNLTLYQLSLVKQSAGNKPILIEEFGAGNGDAITDQGTLGSKELQANVYANVYQVIEDNKFADNLLGSVAYVLYPRDRNTNGWNIVANSGDTLYPAAQVLKQFTGKSDSPIKILSYSTPQTYILTNNDFGKHLTVKKNDILGFAIDLDDAYTYTLISTNPSVITTNQPLIIDSVSHKYQALLHVGNGGTATLTIMQAKQCLQNIVCNQIPTPKDTFTITVQGD